MDDFEVENQALSPAEGDYTPVVMRESAADFEALIKKKLRHCGRECNLSNRSLNDEELEIVVAELEQHTDITNIDFGCNLLTDKSAMILSKYIEANGTLEQVDLFANKIGDRGAEVLSLALSSHPAMRVVDLRANPVCYLGF